MTGLEQRRTAEASVFPAPSDGAQLGINPDGFIWLPVPDADRYELIVEEAETGRPVLRERVGTHYHVPDQPFPAGEYSWRFRAFDAAGDRLGEREPWRFTVPDTAPVAVCPAAEAVLDDLDDRGVGHPCLVFPAAELEELRAATRENKRSELAELGRLVDRAHEMGMPPQPEFHLAETDRERRQYYAEYFGELREYIDGNLRACALSYLLEEDERAGALAREMLLHVCGWNPAGPNSVRWRWGDEPGLSYARILPQCYDWTYDLFDADEREFIERTLVRYCRQTYNRLREGEFFTDPTTSHPGRLPGFLGEMAILLRHRLPDAAEILQFVLDIFNTFYPHWGGDDGGWAEGVSYGLAYNRWYVPFFATFERHTGFSFWERPFYRRIKDFFVYCAPPNAESLPFGDGQESGPRDDPRTATKVKSLLQLYADRFDDPVTARRAAQFDARDVDDFYLLESFVYPRRSREAPAAERANPADSRVFEDVGWASLHDTLLEPDDDTHLVFRSSPYGNVSHSHNNHNAFCLSAGGHMLAISSGYYNLYGSDHHTGWTQRTKAHNSILVDGEGQDRGIHATGRIESGLIEDGYAYVRGAAADAYPDSLETFDRHVLFIEPNLYLIYDDLEATTDVPFRWLLHTHEEPEIDADANRIDAERGPASMRVQLYSDAALGFEHSEEFDPPVNQGILEELREERPAQHHVAAETEPGAETKILAVVSAWQGSASPTVRCEEVDSGVRVRSDAFDGTVALGPGPASMSGEVTHEDGRTASIDLPG